MGAIKRRGKDALMFYSQFISLRHFPYFTFCIIISFRKPCHVPFRKLIPPFSLTVIDVCFLIGELEKLAIFPIIAQQAKQLK